MINHIKPDGKNIHILIQTKRKMLEMWFSQLLNSIFM